VLNRTDQNEQTDTLSECSRAHNLLLWRFPAERERTNRHAVRMFGCGFYRRKKTRLSAGL